MNGTPLRLPVSNGPDPLIAEPAARDLAFRVAEGLKAIPRRGLEVGGFLVGRFVNREILVESLIPIQSTYPDGPRFYSSPEAVQSSKAGVPDDSEIVGLYRSRTDGILELDAQDRALLADLNDDRTMVLLVAQLKDRSPIARIFQHDGRTAVPAGPEFPLDRWLSAGWSPQPAAELAAQWSLEQPAALLPPNPTPSAQPRRQQPVRRWALAALISLLLIASSYFAWRARTPDAPQAAMRREPQRTVIIPRVHDRREQQPAVETPIPIVARQEQTQQERALDKQVEQRARLLEEPTPVEKPASKTPRKQFRLPVGVQRPSVRSDETRLPDTSALGGVDLRTATNPIATVVPARPQPVTPIEFVQPVLARQPRPVVLPPDLRRLLQHEVTLSLRVAVDAQGRVAGVYPATASNKVERSLWSFYSDAVRDWVFEPARRNNIPVPAETILKFRVSTSNQK